MPNTREKLIDAIEKEKPYIPTEDYEVGYNNGLTMAQTIILATDINVGHKWIPVTEDKPKRRGHYFIAYRFKGSDMQFFGEAMWHDDIPDNGYVKGNHFSNEGVDGMYVTHWMEIPKLPQPPKGE